MKNHLVKYEPKTTSVLIKSGIDRKFKYDMNQKTAKRKLLNGASKIPFVKEIKSTCEVLNFNDGSYVVSVIPLIEKWKLKQESGEPIKFKDQDIYVTEQKYGKEQGGIVVDVLTKFELNGIKVVTHCYNTKQKILVNGCGYSDFVKKYLEPYFNQSIEENMMHIQNVNKVVTETLGSKISCQKCEFTADDSMNMSTHRKITHTNSPKKKISYGPTEEREFVTSTRDNSVVGVMNENISIVEIISDSDELETSVPLEEKKFKEDNFTASSKFHCFICQAGFEEERYLTNHEGVEHTEQMKLSVDNKLEDVGSSNECEEKSNSVLGDFVFKSPEIIESHIESNHDRVLESHTLDIESEKFQCDICITNCDSNTNLMQHMQLHHTENALEYVCSRCKYVSRTECGMKRHEDIYCEQCEACLNDRVEYDIHMSLHRRCKNYECEFKTKFTKELQEHVIDTHGRLTCLLCRQECKDRDTLEIHQQSHEKRNTEERTSECQLCGYEIKESEDIDRHVEENHSNLKVELTIKDQTVLKCEICGYSCRLQIQLKKHKERKHAENIGKNYSCTLCQFCSDDVSSLWKHAQDEHPGYKFDCKTEQQMMFNIFAEQNADLMEQFRTLKTGLVHLFQELEKTVCGKMDILKTEFKTDVSGVKDETKKLGKKVEDMVNIVLNKENVENMKRGDQKDEMKTKTSVKPSIEGGEKKKKNKNLVKHKVVWVGTSISKAVDKKKFEKDLNVDMTVAKAHCIKEEGHNEESNFSAIVPEIVQKDGADTIVLQAGSIEITNLDVNKAMMDTSKDIIEYKKEWYQKVENDSKNLFHIAEDAVAMDPSLNVIIVKRLPRYDKPSTDILGIKSQLSKFANHVYDQLWLKQGSPSRIHVVELDLGSDKYYHLKNIIFGNLNSASYDGIHLVGEGASRHLTYRAVQQISKIITKPHQSETLPAPRHAHRNRNLSEKLRQDHTNCEQARYQRSQLARDSHGVSRQARTYADVVRSSNYRYSVPTQNFYAPLNY